MRAVRGRRGQGRTTGKGGRAGKGRRDARRDENGKMGLGRPRRYTDEQEKKWVHEYKLLRKSSRLHPTIDNLKEVMKKKHPSFLPLPSSKGTVSAILRRGGLRFYRMRQGQLIDELIAAERLREAKELSRLSIRHFETRVLFLDFKTFVPRNTP